MIMVLYNRAARMHRSPSCLVLKTATRSMFLPPKTTASGSIGRAVTHLLMHCTQRSRPRSSAHSWKPSATAALTSASESPTSAFSVSCKCVKYLRANSLHVFQDTGKHRRPFHAPAVYTLHMNGLCCLSSESLQCEAR